MDEHNKYRRKYIDSTLNAMQHNKRESHVLGSFGERYNSQSSTVTPENSAQPRYSPLKTSDHFGQSSMSGDPERQATQSYVGDTVRYTDTNDAFLTKFVLQNMTAGWCPRHNRLCVATKKSNWNWVDPYRVGHSSVCKVQPVTQETLKAIFPRYREVSESLQNLSNAIQAKMLTKDTNDAITESHRHIKIQESDTANNTEINEGYRRRRRELDED
jgi:hypothetical protein